MRLVLRYGRLQPAAEGPAQGCAAFDDEEASYGLAGCRNWMVL